MINFETYTFEYLINRALDRVPNTIDKREGSIIYDALAPACYELAEFYMNLNKFLNDVFVSTANGEYLDNRVIEQGLTRYGATKALRKGEFLSATGTAPAIPVGTRFSTAEGTESINYVVVSQYTQDGVVEPGSYVLECEVEGTIGNNYTGDLIPINHLNPLSLALLTEIITPARDVETDEQLRTRYNLAVTKKSFGGNIAQYDQLLKSIEGVGETQIFAAWNGGGTVNCSVVSAEYNSVSKDFITQIQETVDPKSEGSGLGLAPIGHKVTISTPVETRIDISTTLVLTGNYTASQLEQPIREALNKYFLELRTLWGISNDVGNYNVNVYIGRINNTLFSIPGIANVRDTKIKRSTETTYTTNDITLAVVRRDSELNYGVELPSLGTVTINE